MGKKQKQFALWGVAGVLLAGFVGWQIYVAHEPGKYDAFAACLKDKGATFYGAFWCPHCHDQKNLFGNSARLLPYVECSTPDGQGELPACNAQNIQEYPTWVFADGSRQTGVMSLEDLSQKTGCSLPQ